MHKVSGCDGFLWQGDMVMFYLGIDVSKAKLDCLLLDTASNKRKSKTVPNSADGYTALMAWLVKQQAAAVHVVMEPTGVYHEQAALALTDAGLKVSLVNPAQLRQFAQGVGIRTKTDAADSAVLARYGATQKPASWQPPAYVRELRALLARRDAIAEDLRREQNRAEKVATTGTPELVRQSIDQSIAFLSKELNQLQQAIDEHIDQHPDLRDKRALLLSIPGVGSQVSGHLTALLAGHAFDRAEQLAAYLGLVPVTWESDTSVRGRPHLSKAGPAHLRKLLYLPAVVAIRWNPHIKALYARMLARGKSKMAGIGAAMRKLAHLCFGVVKSGKPYNVDWLKA
jgi:transposase